jgi:hypothetical protein
MLQNNDNQRQASALVGAAFEAVTWSLASAARALTRPRVSLHFSGRIAREWPGGGVGAIGGFLELPVG